MNESIIIESRRKNFLSRVRQRVNRELNLLRDTLKHRDVPVVYLPFIVPSNRN